MNDAIVIIPKGNMITNDDVHLSDLDLEIAFWLAHGFFNTGIALHVRKGVDAVNSHMCLMHQQIGCANKEGVLVFFEDHKLLRRENGEWIKAWKNSPFLLTQKQIAENRKARNKANRKLRELLK